MRKKSPTLPTKNSVLSPVNSTEPMSFLGRISCMYHNLEVPWL